ncbi:MAG: hypothetical protein M5U29_16980 [Anaerolineae bacterium]|nr:hypothetical protein [Anaerolineae bacterium]
MDDFLFRGSLADLDPDVAALADLEALRQIRRLNLIPSESSVPVAVREAVGSVFHNLYAEGYPDDAWRDSSARTRFWRRTCAWPNTGATPTRATTWAPSSPTSSRAWLAAAPPSYSPPTRLARTICGSTSSR